MNKRGDPVFCYACLVNPNSNFEKISGKWQCCWIIWDLIITLWVIQCNWRMPTLKWNSKTGIYVVQWSPFYLGCQGPMAYNALQSCQNATLQFIQCNWRMPTSPCDGNSKTGNGDFCLDVNVPCHLMHCKYAGMILEVLTHCERKMASRETHDIIIIDHWHRITECIRCWYLLAL
jgi:hypothetical protein